MLNVGTSNGWERIVRKKLIYEGKNTSFLNPYGVLGMLGFLSMKRMIAISNHGAMVGGGEYSFLELLSHLGVRWQILAVVPERGELASKLTEKGIGTRIIPLPPLRPWHMHKVLSKLIAYTKLCLAYRPALVYANGSRAAFYGGIAGRLLGLPVIWHCRIADPDPYLDPVLSRLSARIIANSAATARRFKPVFRHKTRVVYNAVDLKWLKEEPLTKPGLLQDDWKVILVVARVSKDKRHDILLASFEHAARVDPDVHLVCLGSKDALDIEWWQYLQDRTRRSPYSQRVHWVGRVEDVRPWYRGARILALGSENESFGRVLVEAMACGLPVVATRAGGIPEIVRDGEEGLLVRPGSVEEMAEAFLKLLKDDSLRRQLGKAGLKRAEAFDIEFHVNQISEIFEDCVGK